MPQKRNKKGKFIKTGKYKICIICKKKFYVKECHAKRKFCSKKCYWKSLIGRKLSKECIEKIVKANTGQKRSKAIKRKIGLAHKGKKNHFWKGGISIGENKKEYLQHQRKIRKARIRGAKGIFTLKKWQQLKKEYNYTCPCCGKKEPKIKLVADHIKPISKGGNNYITNIQPLCFHCNSVKYTKTIFYNINR